MTKYLVINSGSFASKEMFNDINKMKNGRSTEFIYEIANPIISFFCKVHNSYKINKVISLPFREIWDKYCVLNIVKMEPENIFIIVMTNISIKKFRTGYLNKISKLKNANIALVCVDSLIDKKTSAEKFLEEGFIKYIYSFDKNDCEKYGYIFTNCLYSKRKCDVIPPQKFDLFFIGRAKDRLDKILEIANKGNSYNLKMNFKILGVSMNKRKINKAVKYLDKIEKYDDVYNQILASNCLLDIVQKGQNGFTMRVYEALFYNKKLITNNPNILNFKYFNPKFMKYVKNIQDIDFLFVKNRSKVDYNYQNDYSPVNFVKDIEHRINSNNNYFL